MGSIVGPSSQPPLTKFSTTAKRCAPDLFVLRGDPYAALMATVTRTMEVLVVDDEPMVREVVARYLTLDGHSVHEVGDGDEAMAWLTEHTPDLVVLDIMLPGSDGLTILRRLRAIGDIPVILLTARSDELDRVLGLELGADDYVVKPFSPRELAVRVRNLLRRSVTAPLPIATGDLSFGPLRIDPSSREVFVDDRPITLTPKEFDLLLVLARSPRQVFSRGQLLELVWDSSSDYQDPATVTVHVGRLRQKLEAEPDQPRFIVTAWGVGYRFEP